MNPYFFTYKGIGVTWFIFLSVISVIISTIIIKITSKDHPIKDKLEDYLLLLLIIGLIGARISYVLQNLSVYGGNFSYIFKLSHMNLSLIGGIIFGLITIFILSKKNTITFHSLLKPYIIPFYFSMGISIWSLHFDGMLIGRKYSGIFNINYMGTTRHPVGGYLSILFLVGIVLEYYFSKKGFKRIYSIVLLVIILIIYYLIKTIFLY